MSNYYAPCFYRIGFAVIPSYIELPFINVYRHELKKKKNKQLLRKLIKNFQKRPLEGVKVSAIFVGNTDIIGIELYVFIKELVKF